MTNPTQTAKAGKLSLVVKCPSTGCKELIAESNIVTGRNPGMILECEWCGTMVTVPDILAKAPTTSEAMSD